MKLFVFIKDLDFDDDFTKRINDWVNLHREIRVIDYDFGYDSDGYLQTVVVKWQ